jgi:hypothetical protein
MPYTAFMSYKQAADHKLAPKLHSALHRFARPFYRLRVVHVFRDAASLSATTKLSPKLVQAVRDSEHFILLASPGAAQSYWVGQEVGTWLDSRPDALDRLLIALTEGSIAWDQARGDFDWEKTDALPPELAGKFSTEPLYVDLRWARTAEDLSLRNPQFLDAVATLAAPLHGKPKDILTGEDVRWHRRFQLAAIVIFGALIALTGVTSWLAYTSNAQAQELIKTNKRLNEERDRADKNAKDAREQAETARKNEVRANNERIRADENAAKERRQAEIAIQNEMRATENERAARINEANLYQERGRERLLADEPISAALYLNAAYQQRTDLKLGDDPALRFLLAQAMRPIDAKIHSLEDHTNAVTSAVFSPDGARIVTASWDKTAKVWDARTGAKLVDLAGHDSSVKSAVFSPDGARIVTASYDNTAKVWDVHLETRSSAEIAEILAKRAPVKLENGGVVQK